MPLENRINVQRCYVFSQMSDWSWFSSVVFEQNEFIWWQGFYSGARLFIFRNISIIKTPLQSLFFLKKRTLQANTSSPRSVKIHYVRSLTERHSEVHLIHIHIVVMSEPVTCFWVLIPPRLLAVSEWAREAQRGRQVWQRCEYVCVLIRRMRIVPHTQVWHVGERAMCLRLDLRMWLIVRVCSQRNVCWKSSTWGQQAVQRRQLFIHGQDPQEAVFNQSTHLELRGGGQTLLLTLLAFTLFQFSPFVLLF